MSVARRAALRALSNAASAPMRAAQITPLASSSAATSSSSSSSTLTWLTSTKAQRVGTIASARGFAAASHDDTHDDFKPKTNASSPKDVKSMIESDIQSNGVIIFMKGSPAAPQCGFSNMACRILDHHGVVYASRNVLASDELRNGIKEYSSWPTIPQLYVKGEFVGGSDIMMSMHQSGELAELFSDLTKK